MPIAWEQIEPIQGRFDFSFLDMLLAQARARKLHLVLLWFDTWKNTNANYQPAWVKLDTARYPRMTTTEGERYYFAEPIRAYHARRRPRGVRAADRSFARRRPAEHRTDGAGRE